MHIENKSCRLATQFLFQTTTLSTQFYIGNPILYGDVPNSSFFFQYLYRVRKMPDNEFKTNYLAKQIRKSNSFLLYKVLNVNNLFKHSVLGT